MGDYSQLRHQSFEKARLPHMQQQPSTHQSWKQTLVSSKEQGEAPGIALVLSSQQIREKCDSGGGSVQTMHWETYPCPEKTSLLLCALSCPCGFVHLANGIRDSLECFNSLRNKKFKQVTLRPQNELLHELKHLHFFSTVPKHNSHF